MATEYNQTICDLKEKVANIYDSFFSKFEATKRSKWEEVNKGFSEIINLIDQYNNENPESEISKEISEEIDSFYQFKERNSFDNYMKAFDNLNRILKFLTLKCEEFTSFYHNLIIEADRLFGGGDYKNAKLNYESAKAFNPDEKYPSDKIDEINAILSLQTKYNDLINEADRLFNSGDYGNAKLNYESAKALKPDEKYPENRIIEIDSLLNAITEVETVKKKQISSYIKKIPSVFTWSRGSFMFYRRYGFKK